MADLPAARPPHPFLLWILGVEIQLGLAQTVHFVAEPTVKFLIIRPDDHIGVGMHVKPLVRDGPLRERERDFSGVVKRGQD